MSNIDIEKLSPDKLFSELPSWGEHRIKKVLDFHFTGKRPRDLMFNSLLKKYYNENDLVCDAASGYGHYLSRFNRNSYGLEISEEHVEFANALKLNVYKRNILTEDLSDLPKVDKVFSIATIEHVESPHIFLRKMYNLLKKDGMIILETSSRPLLKWYKVVPLLDSIYEEHGDHISFFTPDSFKWYAERAGFITLDCFLWSAPIVKRIKTLDPLKTRYFPFNFFACDLVYIGRKDPEWEYPSRSTRLKAENENGFAFK